MGGGSASGWPQWLRLWWLATAVVWCVNADGVSDGAVAATMTCEVCGSDGEVERAFATERFDACHSHAHAPVNTKRQCPPGNRACVTRLQANGGKIVSKSCAERAVSGCHNINHDIYCYCTKPNCNINANLPIRLRHDGDTTIAGHDEIADDDDDQEGSADDSGGGAATRKPPSVVTLVPPKYTHVKPAATGGTNTSRQELVSLVILASVCLRTVFS